MIYANANRVGAVSLPELLLHSIQLGANELTPGTYAQLVSLVTTALQLADGKVQVTRDTDPDAVNLAVALRSTPDAIQRLRTAQIDPLTRDGASELLSVFKDSQSGSARLFAAT